MSDLRHAKDLVSRVKRLVIRKQRLLNEIAPLRDRNPGKPRLRADQIAEIDRELNAIRAIVREES